MIRRPQQHATDLWRFKGQALHLGPLTGPDGAPDARGGSGRSAGPREVPALVLLLRGAPPPSAPPHQQVAGVGAHG